MNKLKNISDEYFLKTVKAWENECPDEIVDIRED